MQMLNSLWNVSLSLAAVSLLGMAALLIGRPIRARRNRRIVRSRMCINQVLIKQDLSQRELRKHVAQAAKLNALALIVLEVLSVVRGITRTTFIARLTDVGAAGALRASARQGRPTDRQRAVEALAGFPRMESEVTLQEAWWDENPAVRFAAMRASIDLGAPPAFVDVLRLADCAGPAERTLAANVLASMARANPSAARLALAQAELQSSTRKTLVEALAYSNDPETTEVLLAIAADSDPLVRASAVGAIGLHPSPLSFGTIIGAFKDASWEVRAAAADAAAKVRNISMEPCLKLLLCDEHWWVRVRAAEALRILNPPQQRAGAA